MSNTRKSDFNEMVHNFHQQFDAAIDEVCIRSKAIPPNCGLDCGPSSKELGPFTCHHSARPGQLVMWQSTLGEIMQDLKEGVSVAKPRRIQYFLSGGNGERDTFLYNDGKSLIRWLEQKYVSPLAKYARNIADAHTRWEDLSSDQKSAYRVWHILAEELLPAWKKNNNLQKLSLALDKAPNSGGIRPTLYPLRDSKSSKRPAKIAGGAQRTREFKKRAAEMQPVA